MAQTHICDIQLTYKQHQTKKLDHVYVTVYIISLSYVNLCQGSYTSRGHFCTGLIMQEFLTFIHHISHFCTTVSSSSCGVKNRSSLFESPFITAMMVLAFLLHLFSFQDQKTCDILWTQQGETSQNEEFLWKYFCKVPETKHGHYLNKNAYLCIP